MAHDTNDRDRSFKGSSKGNFKGRSDYSSGRPGGSVERVPELGDRGIPPNIPTAGGSVMKGPVQDVAGGGDKGIPPMKANPSRSAGSMPGMGKD